MNKYQEALDKLLENVDYKDYSNQTINECDEATSTLQELVDKTTPNKPKRKRLFYNCHNGECDKAFIYYCPVCNFSNVEDMKYCPECSQKLDWSDNNESNN